MWAEEQSVRCPTCGTSDWEWEENETAWTADTWRCHGCEQRDALRRSLTADAEYQHPSTFDGLQVRLFRQQREG